MKHRNSQPRHGLMKIGALAKRTGKTVRAIRYYQELGILEPDGRTVGGFRLFDERDVQKLATVSALQDFGLTLTEIAEVFRGWREGQDGDEAAHRTARIFHRKLKEVRETVQRLQRAEAQIIQALKFISTCMTCGVEPSVPTCTCCEAGDHDGRVPGLITALLPDRPAPATIPEVGKS